MVQELLAGHSILSALSHQTPSHSQAPLSPGATPRVTEYLLRWQHTTTACTSTKRVIAKPGYTLSKSECKCFQSYFKYIADHPFQLLVQGWARYKPPKKKKKHKEPPKNCPEMHQCFCTSILNVSHSSTKHSFVLFLTKESIIINCKIIIEFTD